MAHPVTPLPLEPRAATAPQAKTLVEIMNEGALRAHMQVRQHLFMVQLLQGKLPDDAFRKYLTGLREIHLAIERVENSPQSGLLGAVVNRDLHRSAVIEEDLTDWGGPIDVEMPRFCAEIESCHRSGEDARLLGMYFALYGGLIKVGMVLESAVVRLYLSSHPNQPPTGARTFVMPSGVIDGWHRSIETVRPSHHDQFDAQAVRGATEVFEAMMALMDACLAEAPPAGGVRV